MDLVNEKREHNCLDQSEDDNGEKRSKIQLVRMGSRK